jgi:hypothetical protein
METTLWLCHVARQMNVLLDQGERLDLLEVRRHVFDGDLLQWIDNRFAHLALGLSYIPTIGQAELYERFQDLATVRAEGKYGVRDNGICVVLAYCVEGVEQLASSARQTS